MLTLKLKPWVERCVRTLPHMRVWEPVCAHRSASRLHARVLACTRYDNVGKCTTKSAKGALGLTEPGAAAGCPRARRRVAWACQLPWGMGKLKNKARKYFYVDVQSPKVEVRPCWVARKAFLIEEIGRACAAWCAAGAGRQARQVRPTAAPTAPRSRAVRTAPPWPAVHPHLRTASSARVGRPGQGGATTT